MIMKKKNLFLIALLILCLNAIPAYSTVDFCDGKIHNIDYYISDSASVDQGNSANTTFNLLPNGIVLNRLYGYNRSQINVSGGELRSDLLTYHDNQTSIFSGSIGAGIYTYDNSRVTIWDGSIEGGAHLYSDSQLILNGGAIGGLVPRDNSQVTIWGGVNNGALNAWGNSEIAVYGGSTARDIYAGVDSGDHSQITLIGSSFTVDGISVGYGTLYSVMGQAWVDETTRHLTGILANGNLIDNDFYISGQSSIVLAPMPVPEPTTLLLLGLGAMMLRRKRS